MRLLRVPRAPILPLAQLEENAVRYALESCLGNAKLAARCLGIGNSTMYRLKATYGYTRALAQAAALRDVG